MFAFDDVTGRGVLSTSAIATFVSLIWSLVSTFPIDLNVKFASGTGVSPALGPGGEPT